MLEMNPNGGALLTLIHVLNYIDVCIYIYSYM